MWWQPTSRPVWHYPAKRSHWNSESGPQWRSVASSLTTSQRWELGYKECSDAGTFRLLGISCFHTPAPAVHFSWWYVGGWRSSHSVHWVSVDKPGQFTQTCCRSASHPEGLGRDGGSKLTIHNFVQSLQRDRQSQTSRGVNSPCWRLASRTTNNCGWTEALRWGCQGCSGPPVGLQSLWTTYVHMRKDGECTRLHGLSCRRSAPRHQRHSHLNDIIWRSIKRAHVPAVKEPISMMRDANKRPDGSTLLPWAKGKPMAWDVTVPNVYAESYIGNTSTNLAPSQV